MRRILAMASLCWMLGGCYTTTKEWVKNPNAGYCDSSLDDKYRQVVTNGGHGAVVYSLQEAMCYANWSATATVEAVTNKTFTACQNTGNGDCVLYAQDLIVMEEEGHYQDVKTQTLSAGDVLGIFAAVGGGMATGAQDYNNAQVHNAIYQADAQSRQSQEAMRNYQAWKAQQGAASAANAVQLQSAHSVAQKSSTAYSNSTSILASNDTQAVDPRNASACVSIDRTSNSITAFMVNSCAFGINVTFYDEGDCRDRCGTSVKANNKESIGLVHGQVRWAACPYPAEVDNAWRGTGAYTCR